MKLFGHTTGVSVESGGSKRTPIELDKEHKGEFTQWCIDAGFTGPCCACILKALKVGGRVAKQAHFAYQFGFKANNKRCAAVEKWYGSKEK